MRIKNWWAAVPAAILVVLATLGMSACSSAPEGKVINSGIVSGPNAMYRHQIIVQGTWYNWKIQVPDRVFKSCTLDTDYPACAENGAGKK